MGHKGPKKKERKKAQWASMARNGSKQAHKHDKRKKHKKGAMRAQRKR